MHPCESLTVYMPVLTQRAHAQCYEKARVDNLIRKARDVIWMTASASFTSRITACGALLTMHIWDQGLCLSQIRRERIVCHSKEVVTSGAARAAL